MVPVKTEVTLAIFNLEYISITFVYFLHVENIKKEQNPGSKIKFVLGCKSVARRSRIKNAEKVKIKTLKEVLEKYY